MEVEKGFRFQWYSAVLCSHRCLSEFFKPESSKVGDVIPQVADSHPYKMPGRQTGQCIELEGAQEEAGELQLLPGPGVDY